MSIFKCKMCGAQLDITEGQTIVECGSCGTKQTVPALDDEKKIQLFSRANKLRFNCEFDKAAGIYETIASDFPDDPEAYWGIILCKYGIEYVDDPATGKKIPTCHRSSFESVFDDNCFDLIMENSDTLARNIYRSEAKAIEEIRKGIIEVSSKEEPYDIFICYKETDDAGNRTLDSVIAQDVYDALTEKGYKVFFSRISLEDKLGSEYEPYIFAALNSARVMLAFGTCYDYYNSVWVKNEWSRYLQLIASGQKKTLIPCYKGIDAYDMPKEFAKLQAQDMGKVGAIQDLVRGINKIIPLSKTEKETVVTEEIQVSSPVAPLLKRAFMFLEDGNWEDADAYCERVLDQDPECAQAYLGKLMAELKVSKEEDLKNCAEPFDNLDNFYKASRFSEEYSKSLLRINRDIRLRNSENERAEIYKKAQGEMRNAKSEKEFKSASEKFGLISGFKDADKQKEICLGNAENARKDAIYDNAKFKMTRNNFSAYKEAIKLFESIIDWKDSRTKIDECNKNIEDIKIATEKAEAERKRKAEEARIAAEKAKVKTKKILSIVFPAACALIAFIIVLNIVIIPKIKLNKAMAEFDAGNYDSAYSMLAELGESDTINSGKYNKAVDFMNLGDTKSAYILLKQIPDYKDAKDKISELLESEPNLVFSSASVGDIVKFGNYEQDNNTSNGKEAIEWRVLDVQEGKVLVISDKALDCVSYNEEYTDVTWKTCTLRTWLNGTFYKAAFSSEEQKMIQSTKVTADANPNYDTDPGNDTTDKVFLLSITEVNKYFSSDEDMICKPTDYAVSNGAYVNDDYGSCLWWLRSPGDLSNIAAYVYDDGGVSFLGYVVSADRDCVRPAMWIEIRNL